MRADQLVGWVHQHAQVQRQQLSRGMQLQKKNVLRSMEALCNGYLCPQLARTVNLGSVVLLHDCADDIVHALPMLGRQPAIRSLQGSGDPGCVQPRRLILMQPCSRKCILPGRLHEVGKQMTQLRKDVLRLMLFFACTVSMWLTYKEISMHGATHQNVQWR